MTLLDWILKILGNAAGEIGNVKAILASIATKYPDTKAELDPIIAKLDAPIDLAGLASGLPGEFWDIVQLKLRGGPKAGDAI